MQALTETSARISIKRIGTSPMTKALLCLRQAENWIPVLCFAAMMMLPLVEAVLRKLFHTGIAASASLVQHCCLILGMVGGAIAAREGRLLSLSTVSSFLTGRAKTGAHLFSQAFGASISLVLAGASWQFMLQEKAAGGQIAYGIERWVIEACMPLGFGVIAARLIWRASEQWKGRFLALGVASALVAAAVWLPVPSSQMVVPALLVLVVAALLGTPVFVVLGGAAAILFWGKGQPLSVLPIDHYSLVVNATLPTIPLFTLAGYFLAEGGASKRLIRVCHALVGHFRGGPAIVTAVAARSSPALPALLE
jgi:C4-dicarboxylate transporter, DctM subunit